MWTRWTFTRRGSAAALRSKPPRSLGIKEEVLRRDLGRVLLKLEELQDAQIKQALAPKDEAVAISDQDQAEALELLRDPRLLERIVEDFARCGVVGEETNKLVGYLGVVSRHLEAPLAVIVQSSPQRARVR